MAFFVRINLLVQYQLKACLCELSIFLYCFPHPAFHLSYMDNIVVVIVEYEKKTENNLNKCLGNTLLFSVFNLECIQERGFGGFVELFCSPLCHTHCLLQAGRILGTVVHSSTCKSHKWNQGTPIQEVLTLGFSTKPQWVYACNLRDLYGHSFPFFKLLLSCKLQWLWWHCTIPWADFGLGCHMSIVSTWNPNISSP